MNTVGVPMVVTSMFPVMLDHTKQRLQRNIIYLLACYEDESEFIVHRHINYFTRTIASLLPPETATVHKANTSSHLPMTIHYGQIAWKLFMVIYIYMLYLKKKSIFKSERERNENSEKLRQDHDNQYVSHNIDASHTTLMSI